MPYSKQECHLPNLVLNCLGTGCKFRWKLWLWLEATKHSLQIADRIHNASRIPSLFRISLLACVTVGQTLCDSARCRGDDVWSCWLRAQSLQSEAGLKHSPNYCDVIKGRSRTPGLADRNPSQQSDFETVWSSATHCGTLSAICNLRSVESKSRNQFYQKIRNQSKTNSKPIFGFS